MSSQKKICIIVTQPEWGGAQRYVYDLALGLQQKGVSVTVGTGRGEPVLLNKLKEKGIETHQFAHVVRSITPIEEAYSFFELWHYFRDHRFDVVHLNSSKVGVTGAIVAKLAGIKKVVFTAHGFVFNEKQSFFKKWFYVFLTLFGFLFTDTVIAVSEYDRQSALRLKVVSPKKIYTIYNGVKVREGYFLETHIARNVLSQNIGHDIPIDTHVVGTIAHLYTNKGLRYVIDAASRVCKDVPQTLFVIIGDGVERKDIEQQIRKHKLDTQVFLLGFIDRAETYMKAFDVYVSGSLKEGLPYSVIEARLAGIPIVATAVGGVPEIVDARSGVLVPPADSEALAREIVSVLIAPEACVSQGDNKFSMEEMLEKTFRIYGII